MDVPDKYIQGQVKNSVIAHVDCLFIAHKAGKYN